MAARRHRARVRRHRRRECALSAGQDVGGGPWPATPRVLQVHRRAQADLRGPDQPRIDRPDLPAAMADGERSRQAESIAADRACQPFDLAAGPLMRATLIGAGPGRHLFVLVMHHIISDGVSVEILLSELSAVYLAETTGVPASLPPLWMEYGDYAVWQQDRMRGEELDRQLGYWRDQLRGAPQ